MFAAAPGRTTDELERILRKKFMGYASGNFSDFEIRGAERINSDRL